MYCPSCGRDNSPENLYCMYCGAPINIPQPPVYEKFDAYAFAHPDDLKALNALKAIPGFSTLLKAFFKFYNEREYYIVNMSSNLRLSEEQMPEIYNLLPPICEKLGIKVPELYMTLDVVPNAYTFGDNEPFIVVTSGLINTMPKELISTVIAHECGHIACHHTLYHTMGQMILNGTLVAMDSFVFGKLVSLPIKVGFYYWMRCSEYSADRAALVCDGSPENIIEMCMRFSGFGNDDEITVRNKELFLQQAIGYRNYVQSSGWNKTLEFITLKDRTHPFNSVRAFEANSWANTPEFERAMQLVQSTLNQQKSE